MKLRILEGKNSGQIVDINKATFVVGRDADCDLPLDDEDISRRHAQITDSDGEFAVADLDSTNGVRVNGKKITEKTTIKGGDRLGLGTHILLVSEDADILPDDTIARLRKSKQRDTPAVEAPEPAPESEPAEPSKADAVAQPVAVGLVVVVVALIGWLVLSSGSNTPSHTSTNDDNDEELLSQFPNRTRPNREPPVRRPPTPSVSAPQPTTGYFWVDSDPRGATVWMDDNDHGQTPVLVRNLKRGQHNLKLVKDGYEPFERAILIPHSTDFETYRLRLEDGICLITSSPSGATLTLGTQLLGRSPYLMRGFEPGDYQIQCSESGYTSKRVSVKISAYRPSSVHINLNSETGGIELITVPPGVNVTLDKHGKGSSPPNPDNGMESLPMRFEGLKSGDHLLTIEQNGHRSSKRVRVNSGDMSPIRMMIWKPNTSIRTIDEKTFVGMLKRKNEFGDIVLALSPDKEITLISTQILEVKPFVKKVEDAAKDDNGADAPPPENGNGELPQ